MLSAARSRRGIAVAITVAAGLFALAAPAGGRPAAGAAGEQPTPGAWYEDGPSGRYLLGGAWLFRRDNGAPLQVDTSTAGWHATTVPNAWNAGVQTAAGYAPAITWYRKDFVLPSSSAADEWAVRFESVSNSATIWLNGHLIGAHTGAFLPFEVALPAADTSRSGVNRLVVRVSDAHSLTDLPPLTRNGPGGVVGGWWNYGGLLREVYLRRVGAVDFSSVSVLPELSCATCSARVRYSVVLRNTGPKPRHVALSTNFGGTAASLGAHSIAAGSSATFTGTLSVAHPQLWSPASPHLYEVTLTASGGARYQLQSGIRSVSVSGGHLYLNFHAVHLRGVGLIEDSPTAGSALSQAQQLAAMTAAKNLGATIVRSQYPLSQYEEQLADRLGLMLWSEIPVYQVHDSELRAITPTALALLRENILDNGDHPSIVIWSIANELDPQVDLDQARYIAKAVALAHALDPTRPVGLAFQGEPPIGCQSGYGPLQVLGINDYFGWYPGPEGDIADPSLLGSYLAAQRACYPGKALMVTEFGAEADRSGPIDERGTYEFQSQWVAQQLAAFGAAPWLSGAVYWALSDFLVRPGWTGGNPYPMPPLFTKGLISFAGTPKPAYAIVQQSYQGTDQLG
ncbi:MAG TPA: glycoside hydrolase family 2 TIM barrel-domain containing protein [Solirubrobacteraceae bacterium]|nr:glycoside hydrolase family 2 TIM barrel-domain containing protein [Solirubrobacteraceae bacterium]